MDPQHGPASVIEDPLVASKRGCVWMVGWIDVVDFIVFFFGVGMVFVYFFVCRGMVNLYLLMVYSGPQQLRGGGFFTENEGGGLGRPAIRSRSIAPGSWAFEKGLT